jgi:hypothetical protein
MTTQTLALHTDGFSPDELDRFAGRADAYDDHARMTIDQLSVLAGYMTDLHPNRAYAQGYAAYVKGAELEEQRISGRAEDHR